MRILHFIPYFVPAWDFGGPVQVVYKEAVELIKRGHEVTVYSTDALNLKDRIAEKEDVVDCIKVKRFRNLSNSLACKQKLFLPLGMLLLRRDELTSFDIIHIHEYRAIQNVIMHHYSRKHGIPYVIQAHGALPKMAAKQRLKKAYDDIWGHRLLADAAKVIALTDTEKGEYQALGVSEDKIEIVPNGIDLSDFEDLPQKGEFKRQYGLHNDDKIVLYLGRIYKPKGIDLLVRAYAGLIKKIKNVKLVIVGPDDAYMPVLKRLIRELMVEEHVLFTGSLYKRDKLMAYVDADVFVTPSFAGFPVTFVEACACGTPIITTENGADLEWINNQTGFVVAYDEIHLKNAIAKVLADEELARKFGESGKKLVRDRFNWSKITDKLEHTYMEARVVANKIQPGDITERGVV